MSSINGPSPATLHQNVKVRERPRGTGGDRLHAASCGNVASIPVLSPSDKTEDSLTRYLPAEEVKNRVIKALRKNKPTEAAEIVGIGTMKTGYIVRFKDEASKEAANKNSEWVRDLGDQTKVVRPRFGIVVHRTPTREVNLTVDKAGSIAKITEENELTDKRFKIVDIAWLKRKDFDLGASASLGIWFDSLEATEWAINDGMVFGHRYLGSVELYQIKKKRCHRCQTFGHLAWNCKEALRCGICTGEH
ncbi:hypothetical protein AJ78_07411 [Emergomyces pasteurianus Ep9510]|uniref:CCHC-type domain-containing protein n=1 Tax=Emergomyces pasteurianus Ep9510 TaxID=1447872 RepID=A0A1J9P5C5_9EURO|nr:hypothetical protein AJ78_07411 [Emergomyces pasteurianus Ep9510]